MNIFFAFTPYHSLLAYSAALSEKRGDNVLFIVAEFPEAKAISKAFKNSSLKAFSEVICLPGVYNSRNFIEKILIRKRNAIFLNKFILGHNIENVFVGNVSRIEAQASLHYAKNKNPNCKGIYLEDGTEAYRSEFMPKSNFLVRIFCKAFFGTWWNDKIVSGTSSVIDVCQVLFPELVVKELKTKKIIAVNKENLLQVKNDAAFGDYFISLGFNCQDMREIDVLLIGLYSEKKEDYPKFKKITDKILSYVDSKNLQLAVKYHPRELPSNFLNREQGKKVLVLPKAIPMELIYIFAPQPPKIIIGGHSTALLTARWIFPKVPIISVAPLFDYYDENVYEAFRKNNIKFISNVKDIKDELENIR